MYNLSTMITSASYIFFCVFVIIPCSGFPDIYRPRDFTLISIQGGVDEMGSSTLHFPKVEDKKDRGVTEMSATRTPQTEMKKKKESFCTRAITSIGVLKMVKEMKEMPEEEFYCKKRLRPRWRGFLHRLAFVSAPLWGAHILTLCKSANEYLSVSIFLFALVGLFGVSSSYHRNRMNVVQEILMGKADYTMIFAVVGFSYAPLYAILLPTQMGWNIILASFITVICGAWLSFTRSAINRHLLVGIYIAQAVAQLAPFFFGEQMHLSEKGVFDLLNANERLSLIVMGVCYLVGSQVYAHRWPNPWPESFGYHEIWHALIVIASACTYYVNCSVLKRTYL